MSAATTVANQPMRVTLMRAILSHAPGGACVSVAGSGFANRRTM